VLRAQTRRLHRARLGAVRRLLPAPAASCAAGYAWSKDGSNQCPTSYYAIINAAACETAAAAAGKAYIGGVTDPSFPTGCYFDQGGNFYNAGLYFNDAAVGFGVRGTQLLCSGATRVSHGRLRHHRVVWGTHGVLWGSRRRSNAAHGWMLTASATGLYSCCGYSTDRRGTHRVRTTCTTSCVD
jgi:hypothetical protein